MLWEDLGPTQILNLEGHETLLPSIALRFWLVNVFVEHGTAVFVWAVWSRKSGHWEWGFAKVRKFLLLVSALLDLFHHTSVAVLLAALLLSDLVVIFVSLLLLL